MVYRYTEEEQQQKKNFFSPNNIFFSMVLINAKYINWIDYNFTIFHLNNLLRRDSC